jgi:hypothetical protein
MRVFFNLVNGSESIQDEDGVEASGVEHARAEALNVIREVQEDEAEPRAWAGWQLQARDTGGTLLFSVGLGGSD